MSSLAVHIFLVVISPTKFVKLVKVSQIKTSYSYRRYYGTKYSRRNFNLKKYGN